MATRVNTRTEKTTLDYPKDPGFNGHPYDIPDRDKNELFTFIANFDKVLSYQLVFAKASLAPEKQELLQELSYDYTRYQKAMIFLFHQLPFVDCFVIPCLLPLSLLVDS
jgi:hypothetical protein